MFSMLPELGPTLPRRLAPGRRRGRHSGSDPEGGGQGQAGVPEDGQPQGFDPGAPGWPGRSAPWRQAPTGNPSLRTGAGHEGIQEELVGAGSLGPLRCAPHLLHESTVSEDALAAVKRLPVSPEGGQGSPASLQSVLGQISRQSSKSARSMSSRKMTRLSWPRTMTWRRVSGVSRRACRGMSDLRLPQRAQPGNVPDYIAARNSRLVARSARLAARPHAVGTGTFSSCAALTIWPQVSSSM
jgi:hypothetical protein